LAERTRIVAFDYLRGFVTSLVVLHHSVLAYCRYGHFDRLHYLWSTAPIVDDTKWIGFDVLVLFNDSYFMPLMFLLSGLFVWQGLQRKGGAAYLGGRLRRLGLPFAIAVVTAIPLAYYPSFRMTGSTIGFADFWVETIFSGPWPSGPAWFLAVLLGFDCVAAMVFGTVRRASSSGNVVPFLILAIVSAAAYFPMLWLFGPTYWFSFGPFAVQASRVGLYGVYFLAGVVVGPRPRDDRSWRVWALLAVTLFICLIWVVFARPAGWLNLYGVGLILFCAAANFAWFTIFSRFARHPSTVGDSLAANAYGIYLVHYPVVIWMQFALLNVPVDAIVKAALVFSVALSLSWGIAIVLRRMPGAAQLI